MLKKKENGLLLKVAMYTLLVLYGIISLYPLIWMVFYSLKDNKEIFVTNPFGPPLEYQFRNYYLAVTEFNLFAYFKNSALVATVSIGLGIMFTLMFTYVVARVQNRLTNNLKTGVVMGMFIPIQAIMIPMVIVVKSLHLTNTLWSLIIPYMAIGFPFAVMVLYGFFANLPLEFEESAYMEGSGFYSTFFRIILPQVKSVLSVVFIYQFMQSWNEFSLALVMITKDALKTLPLGLVAFTGQFSTDWGPIGASLVIASLPIIIIYLIFSEKIENAMAFSGIKG